jgi:hypothetical protein
MTQQEPITTTRHPSQGFIDTVGVSRFSPGTSAIFSRSSKSAACLCHGQRNGVSPSTALWGIEETEMVEDSVCALERDGRGKEFRRETPAPGRLGGVE